VTQYTLGGSDNNHFVRNGIRGIVVACGMNEVHTTKEYTTVDQLEKSASLALSLITS
jgi:tripeptide aminopeptidase